mgnify:CR=1 FL=1
MGTLMATGLIGGECFMGVVYAFLVGAAQKAGSKDPANVLALIQPYSAVIYVSMLVFAIAIGALYFWTKDRASDAPAPGDEAVAPQADFH